MHYAVGFYSVQEESAPKLSLTAGTGDYIVSRSMIRVDTKPLRWKVGQMLAVGFGSGEAGASTLESVVNTTNAGNVILFSRNTPDAETAACSVCSAQNIIQAATGCPPLVAIDQEGGFVMRIRKGVIPIPGAMAQAASCLGASATLADIESLGEICGSDLHRLGINWNLAPVVDVNINPKNPVIGVRSYGEYPTLVADYASAFARGLKKARVMATAKHFPGHGDTVVDSHLDLPLISHDLEMLKRVDLVPFERLIQEGIPSILAAHVQFPALEKEPIPATFSRNILEGLLRQELGFDGIICTDCMEMKAVADRYSDPYVKAVLAGADIIVVSHTAERQIEAARSIYRAVTEGIIPEERINCSVERILRFKDQYCGKPSVPNEAPRMQNTEKAIDLVTRVSQGSLTFLGPQLDAGQAEGLKMEELKENASAAGLTPALAPVSRGFLVDIMPENLTGVEDETALPSVANEIMTLGASSAQWKTARISASPTQEEIKAVRNALYDCGAKFFHAANPSSAASDSSARDERFALALSLFAPFSHNGQFELLALCADYAAKHGSKLIVFLMRSPYDYEDVLVRCREAGVPDADILVLAAYEYTSLSAHSVAEFLLGNCKTKGVCPVTVAPHNVTQRQVSVAPNSVAPNMEKRL
ncbi:MAG TPA: glycoside hydrolase family 3 N-terminal domain-containing protein [Spirochaetales bacterium]|nr:glycoside hydrolase family 3 N-terminal domain-containing protein [Spirochaetales bacterium]